MGPNEPEGPSEVQAIEDQIEKLRAIRLRWASGEDLSKEERGRRELTLDLLDSVIQDLQKKKLQLQRASS